MEAKELMIGDWVGRVFDDKHIDYRQVDWIRTGEIGMRYQKVWAIGCIEPIPLTPEILEKNGWDVCRYKFEDDIPNTCDKEERGNQLKWMCETLAIWIAYEENSDGAYADIIVPCKYVHQLQQALRLVGLNDLADNFKV